MTGVDHSVRREGEQPVADRGADPAEVARMIALCVTGELRYASELVGFIREETGEHFHIEIAAYPEMHPQARNFEDDIANFVRKAKAGAELSFLSGLESNLGKAMTLGSGYTFTGITAQRLTEKPPAAWSPEQVVEFMLGALKAGDDRFTADNSVTRKMNIVGDSGNDVIYAMALQSDGKIVAVGADSLSNGSDFAIARYNTNGSLDTTFSGDGKFTVDFNDDESLREQVRSDSKVKLRTLGLLGDKVLDIKPGTPQYGVLRENDTLQVEPSLDLDAVLAQAAGAVDDVVGLTRDFRQITGGLVRGEGTVGRLLTDRALYDQFTGTMARTNALLTRVQTSRGTVSRLIDDPALYNDMVALVGSMNGLVAQVNTSEGTVGKLLRDTTLYSNLVGITQGGDSLMKMLTQGDGLANKLLTDQTLYDQVNKLVTDLSAILADVRQDPQPYTKGLVQVCVFGCKKDE